ncbi:hypothetical protein [Thalassospira marina]|uniref:Uncharacterized protein n=1 Tax=Thalassospira marina TaxID=2048283 RepID=A0A2N3KXC5_9PROT|nr:hypothetical protein [Thalassospira marina]AUG54009.1 hypothetical protein CSC3H3_15740 [Thalassospira marina]PKR55140.1 hypothetical protein COO20_07125 [Thalassospira marina]
MDWVPIAFGTFKVVALCVAMFFAIKWHYDQGKKGDRKALLRSIAKMSALLILAALVVALVTFALVRWFGLDMSY